MAAFFGVGVDDAPTPLSGVAVKRYLELRPEEWEVILARVAAALEAGDTAEVSRIALSIDMTYNGLKKRHSAGMTAVSTHGPAARLKEWEKRLADHVQWQVDMGDPLTREEAARLATHMGSVLGVEVGGRAWMRGFEKRHKLSLRRPQPLEVARALSLTTERAAQFYSMLEKVYALFPGIDPRRVYNMDETGLEPGNTKPRKVLCKTGTRNLSAVKSGDRRHVSAVVCGNAAGEMITTMLLYPKSFKKNVAEMQGWPDAVMRFGESAYMDDEAWVAWTKLFVEKTGGNCVLIVDQHKTRYNMLGLSILAHAGVGLLTLPAHTTQALQPLDVSVFRPMKAACERIQRRTGAGKLVISAMIKEALAEATRVTLCSVTHTSTSNLIAGFKKTGIWPRDPTAVTKECVLGDNYKRELDKRRAAAAMLLVAAGPAAAAGGAGDAAGGAGRAADGGDDDDDSDDDARGDDVAEPAPAAPLDPAVVAVRMDEILKPSEALMATWDALISKPDHPAAGSRFLSGAGHLANHGAKIDAAKAAQSAKEVKQAATKERRRQSAVTKAALLAARTAKKAATLAAKAAKAADAEAAGGAAAPKTMSPASAAAAAAAPPAAPTVRKLKVRAPSAAAEAPAASGTKRKRGDTAPAAVAVGGGGKRSKRTTSSPHD